jgi:hypothetical protein
LVFTPNTLFMRSCAAWLAEFWPDPPRFSAPGLSLAALMKSAQLLMGLCSGTTSASGV